jgi:hypothetical protein
MEDMKQVMEDALLLLTTANQHGHLSMWQDARRALLARAAAAGAVLSSPIDLEAFTEIRRIAKGITK